jgi:4-hydroxy-tetrahydrodipicolinate synthase
MKEFKGCGTALVTPFREGEVDYEAYASLIDRQVEAGVDFLVALATTGETPALSSEEKVALLKLTAGLSGGRPVLVGCGSNSVAGTLANMALLDGPEADGWLVVVPFYNKPTQEGMYRYFKAIAEQTSKPVVIYNVPGRTGANMTAETCLRLAREVPNIVATKEASGKLDQIKAILEGAPQGFTVLSGDDSLTLPAMKLGAGGVISVASNIAPAQVSSLVSAAREGKWKEAEEIDSALAPLFKACFVESNPIPVKAGMEALGLMTAEVRLPLTEATLETKKLISSLVAAL